MQRTRVKVCGLTRQQDVLAAASAGVDALGFVFYPPSPRAVDGQQAAELLSVVPPFVTTVGLFVDAEADQVRSVLQQAPLDLLQFHGDESVDFCEQFQRPYIKAIRMRPGVDLVERAASFDSAQALLVDSYVPGQPGGTGKVFDWQRLPGALHKPLILAGGLNPENVAASIAQVQPWAVDVSGGVEERNEQGQLRAGIKSAAAINAFIRGVSSV